MLNASSSIVSPPRVPPGKLHAADPRADPDDLRPVARRVVGHVLEAATVSTGSLRAADASIPPANSAPNSATPIERSLALLEGGLGEYGIKR
jgi:hypothetical protein